MDIKTYYIANNKTRHATILQTRKTREDIWHEVEDDTDVVFEFETTEQAQNEIVKRGMTYEDYSFFLK